MLQYLCDIHQFVYRHLDDELLWATSMPCALDGDASIPLAQFGTSNVGRMKTIYRHGLGVRYGRIMQAISGVHFNYSFSPRLWGVLADINQSKQPPQSFTSEQYFGVLRNYRRYGWLVLYLFGTSPAVSKSFFAGRETTLAKLDADTFYEPYGTSLRMSDIGYRNKNQATVSVSVNSLDEYVRDLSRAIGTPYPPYEKIGVKVDGEYQQLNSQHPADRKRILQLHPAEARGALRRAPDQGIASGRSGIRRGARAGCERIRSGRRQSEQAALPGSLSRAVPAAGERADRAGRTGEPGCQSFAGCAARPRTQAHAEARRA